jgi:anti-sigma regulatory factor (Ser/Thr protein kinase)
MVETARLLTSELAANAVVHAGSGFDLAIAETAGTVRIEVTDRNGRMPELHPADQGASHGRGLQLVARLAASWGVVASTEGKTVWFELRHADFA